MHFKKYSLILLILMILKVEASIDIYSMFVKNTIEEQLNLKDCEALIHFDNKYELELLNQEHINNLSLKFLDPQAQIFVLSVSLNGAEEKLFNGKFALSIKVPVLNRNIKKGEIILIDDLSYIYLPSHKRQDNFLKTEQIINMEARKNLLRGTIVKKFELLKPILIRQNDIINLIYKAHGIEIKADAIALKSGGFQDIISVKNKKSGAIVYGTIIDNKTVEVQK